MTTTDPTVPFLRYDTVVVNKDGTFKEWFVNAMNNLINRTGGEAFNGLGGVLNGATQLQQQLAAEAAARIANDAAIRNAGDGTGAGNSNIYTNKTSSGATWVTLVTVTVTPGGAGGDYTISAVPDGLFSGGISDFGVFNGNWRIIEELTGGGTEHLLASGTFQLSYTPEQVYGGEGGGPIVIPASWFAFWDGLPTTAIAANEAAQVDIRFEIQRASGANEITAPGLSGAMTVTWTA